MSHIEFNKEASVLQTRRVQQNGILERNINQTPFITISRANLVCNDEIISGANVVIVGVEGSGLEANGSNGGGPLYMTDGEIGSSSDISMQRSSLSRQGNGSIL